MKPIELTNDGNIKFQHLETIPSNLKKFGNSAELKVFYQFIYENNLQEEASELLKKIHTKRLLNRRKMKEPLSARNKKKAAEKLAAEKKKAELAAQS